MSAKAANKIADGLHEAVGYARGWNAGLEKAAAYLDECAQDWNRIRDPGMANHCRKHAKAIRDLRQSP